MRHSFCDSLDDLTFSTSDVDNSASLWEVLPREAYDEETSVNRAETLRKKLDFTCNNTLAARDSLSNDLHSTRESLSIAFVPLPSEEGPKIISLESTREAMVGLMRGMKDSVGRARAGSHSFLCEVTDDGSNASFLRGVHLERVP